MVTFSFPLYFDLHLSHHCYLHLENLQDIVGTIPLCFFVCILYQRLFNIDNKSCLCVQLNINIKANFKTPLITDLFLYQSMLDTFSSMSAKPKTKSVNIYFMHSLYVPTTKLEVT